MHTAAWDVLAQHVGRAAGKMEGVADAVYYLNPNLGEDAGFDMTPAEAEADLKKDYASLRIQIKKLELLTLALSIP